MKYTGSIFKNTKFDFDKLKQFGFSFYKNAYTYQTNIMDNTFTITINISPNGSVDTNCFECSTGEKYNLIYVKDAEGEFVGKMKESFEQILIKIKKECTLFSVFKSEYTNLIIEYLKEKYHDNPEYLWDKFPNNAIFRKKDNLKNGGKWYAAILTVSKNKLGFSDNKEIEVINLKANPEIIEQLVDNKRFFRGYHMNKKHWYTICLDGSVDIEEIKRLIDNSYRSI